MGPDSGSRRQSWIGGLLLAMGLVPLSCAGVSFQQERIGSAPPDRAMPAIQPGVSDLGSCLRQLGAPTEVARSEDGQTHVLTWAWSEQSGWGFFLTLPLGDYSPSLNWADEQQQPQYVRLFFDQDWKLVDLAQG